MSPRSFAKRLLPDPKWVAGHPRLRWLAPVLAVPGIWHFGRRSVAGGFSLGLFLAFIPIPIQQLLAIPFSVALRVNLPAALGAVWLSNPVTFGPIFYFAYRLGLLVTGAPPAEFAFTFSLDSIGAGLSEVIRPLLVGCLICATVSSVLGNVLVRSLWRIALMARWRARRHRHGRTRATGTGSATSAED